LVVVTLVTDKKMFRDRLAATAVQADVAKAIQQAAGTSVRIEWRLPEIGGAAAAPVAKGIPTEPGPRTKGVLGAFGGRVVQVNPEDRVPVEKPPPALDDDAPMPDEPPPNLQE